MDSISTTAYPRVGLLGNPSDGYGGSTLGFTFSNFRTVARLERAVGVTVAAGREEEVKVGSVAELIQRLPRRGAAGAALTGGAALQAAALAKFHDHCANQGRSSSRGGGEADGREAVVAEKGREGRGEEGEARAGDGEGRGERGDGEGRGEGGERERRRGVEELAGAAFTLGFDSDIPMQVGLAGSSAIVIATLRALSLRFGVAIPPFELSELALLAETEELRIAAGPQDRVIQSYQGLMFMDFATGRSPEHYRRLDPALLPPMFVAYDPNPGVSSGKLHDDVRRRLDAGDPEVVAAIATFPKLAAEGVECLERGNIARFRELVDANFDTRASIWPLRPLDRELVALGRAEGAAVKFSGSGGAVVGVLRGDATEADEQYEQVAASYARAGFRSLRPSVVTSEHLPRDER